MRFSAFGQLLAVFLLIVGPGAGRGAEITRPARFELRDGDRVIFVGDRLIEGEQYYSWIETMLTTRFPDRNVTFRNLGWNGDTPAGESRLGLSLLQAGTEPPDEAQKLLHAQIAAEKPTVAFIGYGMASSFAGPAGLPAFEADYRRLVDTIAELAPEVRFVLLGPIRHEALGAPWPDPAAHNAQLAAYTRGIAAIAAARNVPFIPLDQLHGSSNAGRTAAPARLTDNGIHLNDAGYRRAAEVIEDQLFGSAGAWRNILLADRLAAAIRRKNEWFFHRSRPANMAYIFGFRRREQGRNAGEVEAFEEFIAAEEKRIAALRSLRPVAVAEVPRHIGNASATYIPQPRPAFEVAEGLEVTLWADNPLLHKPIQINFDPAGRLWVASSEVYPQIEPGQAASDKIIILEDTQGLGRADKATMFADGLLIPTGLEPGDGGVYVAQSTELLHFRDTDGDGVADERRTVLSGFGTEDSHHNLHTLKWGPDARLYMNQAVYTRTNTETPHGVVRLKAGGTFRFDPRDQRMEVLFRGWVNAWGHQFDDFGQSFVTDGAGRFGINWAVPGATYHTLAPARRILESVSPGAYPKFCGIEIIRSAHFPADWQGDIITSDFRAHRVVRFKITEQGSGYVTQQMPDVIQSTAASFRPLDAKLGPDGALYLADWSNPIIQHGEVDFRDPRRDKEHGRIWRIAVKGRAPLPRVDFTRRSNAQLLDALLSPNRYDEQQARRVLVERGAANVTRDLAAFTAKQREDRPRLQALWMHQAFNLPAPALQAGLLTASDGRVRAAAVRVMAEHGDLATLTRLVADPHPRVRLEAVRALGRIPTAAAVDAALSVLDQPMDAFLDYALWLTINELAPTWLAAIETGTWVIDVREKQLEFTLKAIEPALASKVLGQLLARRPLARDGAGPWIELIGAAGGPAELQLLFERLRAGSFTEPAALRALSALKEAARLRSAQPAGDLAALGPLLSVVEEATLLAAVQLAGAWKTPTLANRLIELAGTDTAPLAVRTAAIAGLREIRGPEAIAALTRFARTAGEFAVRREAVVALATIDLDASVPDIVATLAAAPNDAAAEALWRGVLVVRGAGSRIAAALATNALPAAVARAGLRPAREGAQNETLVPVLLKSAGLSLANARLSPAELQTLATDALARGDAARGELLYRRAELACVACHAIGGAGGKVGPDLTSIGASAPPDYLVESLVNPAAKIKEGYHAVVVSTKDLQELSGMVVKEAANELILRTAANQEISVPTNAIVRRGNVGSLMPAGLLDTLLPDERLDVIKFLSQLGKPGDYDAARGGVARAWQLYLVVSANQHLGIEPVVRGDPTFAGWVPVTSLVNGALTRSVFESAFPGIGNTRGLFGRTQFHSASGGRARFTATGVIRGVWINGESVKPGNDFTVPTHPGVNTIVLQFVDNPLPESVSLRSDDVTFLLE